MAQNNNLAETVWYGSCRGLMLLLATFMFMFHNSFLNFSSVFVLFPPSFLHPLSEKLPDTFFMEDKCLKTVKVQKQTLEVNWCLLKRRVTILNYRHIIISIYSTSRGRRIKVLNLMVVLSDITCSQNVYKISCHDILAEHYRTPSL